MDLINEPIIEEAKRNYADARKWLSSWRHEVEIGNWTSPDSVKALYPRTSFSARQSGGFQNQGEKVPAGGSDQLPQGHRFRQILRHARGVRQNQRRGGMKRISNP